MLRFEKKVVIVTGGCSGIGRETALAFAREGAAVVVGDTNHARGPELAQLLSAAGGRGAFVQADVSREDDCRALVEAALAQFGALHCAVNNAGVEGAGGLIVDADPAECERVLRINTLGVLLGMKHQMRAMNARGGSIVNVSSIAGLVGLGFAAAYVASKHAVVGLTRAGALEGAKARVRVNAVCPGAIETEMLTRVLAKDPRIGPALRAAHPMARFGAPAEVASAILWLCSDEASFVTGQALGVEGGYLAQ